MRKQNWSLTIDVNSLSSFLAALKSVHEHTFAPYAGDEPLHASATMASLAGHLS